MIRRNINQQGYVLILTLVVSAVFLTIGLSMGSLISARYKSSKNTTFVENAVLAADAGITDTLNTILSNTSFTGSPAKELYSDTSRGMAKYTTTVSYNATTKLYTIRSTGYAYRAPGDVEEVNKKTVEVTAAFANSSVPARMAVGPGGLSVPGGKIGGQNVWVNGKVSITNSGVIGSTGWGWISPTSDSTLNVANFGCGNTSTYLLKCTGPMPGTGEPIQMDSTGTIYGTVCANNQTTTTGIFPGQSTKGLIINCNAPVVTLPQYDRQALYNSMTHTRAGFACNAYFGPNNVLTHLETNTIYTSSITIGKNNGSCDPQIRGNVYIRGDLNLTDFAGMTVADTDSLGNTITTPPIVIVEGTINIGSVVSAITKNASGVGALFVSFKSVNATCNSDPGCVTLPTEADKFNSMSLTTVNLNGDINMDSSAFYSYFGTANVQTGSVGGVAGQRVIVSSTGGFFGGYAKGGVNRDSYASGDAFGGKVQLPVWNIVTYRQIF